MWLAALLWGLLAINSDSVAADNLCNLSPAQTVIPWISDNYGRLKFPKYNPDAADVQYIQDLSKIAPEPCVLYETDGSVICREKLNATFISLLKSQSLSTFALINYDREKIDDEGIEILGDEKWLPLLPQAAELSGDTYAATGDVKSPELGIGLRMSTVLTPNKNYDGFIINGETFSNELRVGWQIEAGQLRILDNNDYVVIQVDAATAEIDKGGWSFSGECILVNTTSAWQWALNGTITCPLLPAPITFKGTLETTQRNSAWKITGNLRVKPLLTEWQLDAIVTSKCNEQVTITDTIFSDLKIKHIIFKDSNFMGDFHKNALQGIIGLETITFTNSKLENLPRLDLFFEGLNNLKAIYFESSAMPNIEMGSYFTTLPSIELVSFKGSGPLQLNASSLYWLRGSNLTYFNLQDCNINVIANSMGTLRYLDLSYASLTEENALEGMLRGLKITHLSLAGLQLTRVPYNALQHVKGTLRCLTLRENNFQKVADENMFSVILDFPEMPQLEDLDLTNSGINYIETGVFDNLTGLKKLFLARNNVENVQEGWYGRTPPVLYIDLSWNGDIAQKAEFSLQAGRGLSQFNQLLMVDFSNAVFKNADIMVSSISNTTRILSLCNTNLQTTAVVRSLIVPELTKLDISGNPNLEFGSIEMSNFLYSLHRLKHLSAKNNRITNSLITSMNEMKNSHNASCFLETLETLDLSGNSLKILPETFFSFFPRLRKLDVSSNSIGSWSMPLYVSSNLKTFMISDNKIETITNVMLIALDKMKNVELGRNPFACDCNMKAFSNRILPNGTISELNTTIPNTRGFIMRRVKDQKYQVRTVRKTHNINLTDWANGTNYYCYISDSADMVALSSIRNQTELCRDKQDWSVNNTAENFNAVYVGVAVCLALCLAGGFIYWKWWEIRLMTRAVRNAAILTFMGNDEPEEPIETRYDAFISYSEKDRSWVLQQMLPHLEQWNQIRVCLHERDFQVGVSIMENITCSMEQSRHLVLVLSQSFVRSQWCQFELQLAQHRLIESKRDRLVLILLEPIPAHQKPKTLRYLMRTNTYLEWPGDSNKSNMDRFWERLLKSIE